MLYAGRMRVGGLQQVFNSPQQYPLDVQCAGKTLHACALTVFPLIKVVSKLPLC
jgi:hypothetical protein